MIFQFRVYGKTDVGLKRKRNEDYFLINPEKKLFLVADGLGGHKGGDVASSLACEYFNNEFTPDSDILKKYILSLMARTNDLVYKKSLEDEELRGMGSTLIICYLEQQYAYFSHVGDVRGYIYRDNKLTQFTEDHSLVADLVRKKLITKEEAENHQLKNIVSQVIGSNEEISPGFYKKLIKPNDIFLLCSDGLWGMTNILKLEEILKKDVSLEHKTEELIESAKEAGGADNITVVLINISDITL